MAIKSTDEVARDRRRRMKGVDDAHRAAMAALHADFNREYDELLAAHDLGIAKLSDHHSFPLAFHADLAEAKANFNAGRQLADQARASAAASLRPPATVRLMTTARRVSRPVPKQGVA